VQRLGRKQVVSIQFYQLSFNSSFRCHFKFSSPEPLFRIIYGEIELGRLLLVDLIYVVHQIKEMLYEVMTKKTITTKDLSIPSAKEKSIRVEVKLRAQ
jgi:hypothetical protein